MNPIQHTQESNWFLSAHKPNGRATQLIQQAPEKPATGLTLSCFVSRIRSRIPRYTERQSSNLLSHVILALRSLIINVSLYRLSELASFSTEANSLLDCAAALGLQEQELRHWESMCRDIEFGLFQLHAARHEFSLGIFVEAEIRAESTSDLMEMAREDLDLGLRAMSSCQKDITKAQFELLIISEKLRDLQLKRKVMLEQRAHIKLIADKAEENFSDISSQVDQLEESLLLMTGEHKQASKQLEITQERRAMLTRRSEAVRAHISAIQAKLR